MGSSFLAVRAQRVQTVNRLHRLLSERAPPVPDLTPWSGWNRRGWSRETGRYFSAVEPRSRPVSAGVPDDIVRLASPVQRCPFAPDTNQLSADSACLARA